jgi:hypothetical protein
MMIWKEAIVVYYPGVYLDGLRNTMKNLSQDTWCPSQDLN